MYVVVTVMKDHYFSCCDVIICITMYEVRSYYEMRSKENVNRPANTVPKQANVITESEMCIRLML